MTTTDDLAAMSDEELNLAVAREMFGIKRIYQALSDGDPWDGRSPWPMYIPSGKPWRTHSLDAIPLPRYSTDIAAAWLVVKRMREREHRVNVTNERDDVPWAAVFQHEKRHLTEFGTAIADSAPRAICLAALRAVRAQEPHP